MGRILLSICAVVVAAGLVGAAPAPTHRAEAQYAKAGESVAKPLEDIAAALKKMSQASEIEEACDPPSDRRTSDLCAQWKAADAASDAAWWAMLGFWASVATICALGGNIWQTSQGLRSAREANDTAKEAIANDMRPWLSVKLHSGRFEAGTTQYQVDGFYLPVKAEIRNQGRAPASGVRFDADIQIRSEGNTPESASEAFCVRWITGTGMSDLLFAGDAPIFRTFNVFIPQESVAEAVAGLDFKMISFLVIGCVSYRSGYTKEVRQTRLCHGMHRLDEQDQTKIIDPTKENWWLDRIQLDETPLVAEAT